MFVRSSNTPNIDGMQSWMSFSRQRRKVAIPSFSFMPDVYKRQLRPRVIYEILFAAASATLVEFAANPRWLGGKLAFSLVLHTWKQDLGRHVHVHALVAGGALTAEGEWKSPTRGFLFPVRALSRVFRGKFMACLLYTSRC